MSLRLSSNEARIRDLLSEHLGVDQAGVMRQALLRMARAEGITLPPEEPHKPTAKRGRSGSETSS